MSSDSDHTCSIRLHTQKRKKIIISDSDTSDDSIIVQNRRKKKIHRVFSEEESSSDESDVPKPVIRRRNYKVISEDESNYNSSEASKSLQSDSGSISDWQSDWTSSDELNENTMKYNVKHKVLSKTKEGNVDIPGPSSPHNVNANSDSGDEQLEKCPICLLPFRKQQIGAPSVCEHCFCLDCLVEWSKNINTCPVDRQSFTVIHVRDHVGGEIVKHLPIEIVPRIENQVQDDPTFCEVCHESDREDRMLLCDGCDRGYHLECLTPPMTEVPIEEWYCPNCNRTARARMVVTDFIAATLVMRQREQRRILRFERGNSNVGMFRVLPRIRSVAGDSFVHTTFRNREREINDRVREDIPAQFVDPSLPSTSSGPDWNGENSRSRSTETSSEGNNSFMPKKTRSKTKMTKRKKKRLTKSSRRNPNNLVREVRIKELNDDGEEEEIVTYVKVASTSRRKCNKRTKKTRKVYR